jgi:hypothetical protein
MSIESEHFTQSVVATIYILGTDYQQSRPENWYLLFIILVKHPNRFWRWNLKFPPTSAMTEPADIGLTATTRVNAHWKVSWHYQKCSDRTFVFDWFFFTLAGNLNFDSFSAECPSKSARMLYFVIKLFTKNYLRTNDLGINFPVGILAPPQCSLRGPVGDSRRRFEVTDTRPREPVQNWWNKKSILLKLPKKCIPFLHRIK